MKLHTALSVACLAAALLACPSEAAASGGGGEREVEFKTIARGAYTSYRLQTKVDFDEAEHTAHFAQPAQQHEFLVIDNEDAWRAFWATHTQPGAGYRVPGAAGEVEADPASLPGVDFEHQMVVVLFSGRRILSLAEANAIEAGRNDAEGRKPGIEVGQVLVGKSGNPVIYFKDQRRYAALEGEPADDTVIANPYHIIVLERLTGTVKFSDAVRHHVDPQTTTLFGIILAAMILCLALEETLHAKKSVIVGVFAMVSLFLGDAFGILPIGPVENIGGELLVIPVYITAVDWEVIAIILASSIFVDVTSQSGIFTWIAIKLTKQSGGDPYKLLVFYSAMTVLFSAVLNNVTAMIIVGSLTSVSLRKLQRTDLMLGFLLVEGLLTNIGGLLTLISSVPNIIVGNTAEIAFVKFFLVAAPYVVFATIATILMGAKLYKVEGLKTDEEREQGAKMVAGFDENDGIESKAFFNFSATIFVLFILTLASTSVLPIIQDLNMGYVAFLFATIMLVVYKHEVDRFYSKVDWDLIGFFAALFIVINVMEHAQVLHAIGGVIGQLLGLGKQAGSAALLTSAAIASSVTDNIPLAAMLAKILSGTVHDPDSPFWWSVIFGANLGGNITPIGSASTVVACTVMAKNDVKLGFMEFVLKAIGFAAIQIVLAIVYVLLLDLRFVILWPLSLLALGLFVWQMRR